MTHEEKMAGMTHEQKLAAMEAEQAPFVPGFNAIRAAVTEAFGDAHVDCEVPGDIPGADVTISVDGNAVSLCGYDPETFADDAAELMRDFAAKLIATADALRRIGQSAPVAG